MSRKGRVLVVEDNKEWQMLLSEILRDAGFLVNIASTIEEAREHIENRIYHIITIDIRLEDSLPTDSQGMTLLNPPYSP